MNHSYINTTVSGTGVIDGLVGASVTLTLELDSVTDRNWVPIATASVKLVLGDLEVAKPFTKPPPALPPQGVAVALSASYEYPCQPGYFYSASGTVYVNLASDRGLSLVTGVSGNVSCNMTAEGVAYSLTGALTASPHQVPGALTPPASVRSLARSLAHA